VTTLSGLPKRQAEKQFFRNRLTMEILSYTMWFVKIQNEEFEDQIWNRAGIAKTPRPQIKPSGLAIFASEISYSSMQEVKRKLLSYS
jgi:hypothetical protein